VGVVELLFNVMGPVVLIVALGWFAGMRLPFDIGTLSRLAFYVLGPAFVLDVFADATLDGSVVLRLVVAAWAGMLAGGLIAWGLARGGGLGSARRGSAVMSSAYGNVGNAGLAISAFALGDDAIPVAAVLMIVINITGICVGVTLASAQSAGIGSAIARALSAPMTIAAAVALVMNVGSLEFPLVLDRSISVMGAALIPVMLLTLGMQMAGEVRPTPEIDLGIVTLAKLVCVPLVAAAVGWLLGLDGDAFGVLVIQSSMPPAVFCAVVALEFDMEPERTTRTVLGTTLIALLTIPVALLAVT